MTLEEVMKELDKLYIDWRKVPKSQLLRTEVKLFSVKFHAIELPNGIIWDSINCYRYIKSGRR